MSSKSKGWIVTISGERTAKQVAKELKAAGFTVDQVLDDIGSITGKADDKVVGKVRSIRGVADVSSNEQIDIGPPDSPTTW
ncbi:MAG: hypothetical protein ACT4P6_01205 [Gemmatimonadaceae bacterium]